MEDLGHSQPLGEKSMTQQLETATNGDRAGAIKKKNPWSIHITG